MKTTIKRDVEKATVKIVKKGGRGVLVRDSLIITAAHCIDFSCAGEMVLAEIGERFVEEIETTEGLRFKVAPYVVEPVLDVAVLGSLDGHIYPDEWDEFERFCENAKPILVCQRDFQLARPFPVYIYTHTGEWLAGTAGTM